MSGARRLVTTNAASRKVGRGKRDLEAVLEADSQRMLGMSAKEFRRRLRRGDLPDDPAVGHLTMVARVASG